MKHKKPKYKIDKLVKFIKGEKINTIYWIMVNKEWSDQRHNKKSHLVNFNLVNLPVRVTTSVSTLTSSDLGWGASHLLLSLSFIKGVTAFFSLSFLLPLRVTNQVPALSEVKIDGNRNNFLKRSKIQNLEKNCEFFCLLFRFLGKTQFLESRQGILTFLGWWWLDQPLIQIRSIKKRSWHLHC